MTLRHVSSLAQQLGQILISCYLNELGFAMKTLCLSYDSRYSGAYVIFFENRIITEVWFLSYF